MRSFNHRPIRRRRIPQSITEVEMNQPRALIEDISRKCRDIIDTLHDLDGTGRNDPRFTCPFLRQARDKAEHIAELVHEHMQVTEVA